MRKDFVRIQLTSHKGSVEKIKADYQLPIYWIGDILLKLTELHAQYEAIPRPRKSKNKKNESK